MTVVSSALLEPCADCTTPDAVTTMLGSTTVKAALLKPLQLAHEPGQPPPGGGVLLAADSENTQPGVDKVLYLSRSSAYSLVASDDDEVSRRDRLNPVGIEASHRALRNQGMANMNDIVSGGCECLS
jgi:hypothetical protein